ncbi:MAG: methyltransferase domain-containing protein [Oscillospiraceae bacterium]|nr:methyltransferase domain-containing protein [Oscillospiraceae bacterium]
MYNDFARLYDRLMADVPYGKFVDYYFEIFRRFGCKTRLGLDLGCGTGNVTLELSRRGADMIGADISAEMLSVAGDKATYEGLNALFLNQDMAEFELYGTVDFIVSSLDSVNYVTEKNRLKKVFKLVNNYLDPGGLFVFDVNTEYKLSTVLGDNTFVSDDDDIFYSWQNSYDKRSRLCDFYLSFFERREDGSFARFDEVHTERAYGVDELKAMLKDSGLKVEGVFHDLTFQKPRKNSERVFFVAREQGKIKGAKK